MGWIEKEDYIIYIEYKYCFVKYFEFFDKCIKFVFLDRYYEIILMYEIYFDENYYLK